MTSERILENSAPAFLYGTAWKEDATQACVEEALRQGFRGIDTANQRKHYVEAAVGAALLGAYDAGLLNRVNLFLQTKFTHLAGQDSRLPYDPSTDIQTQVMQSFASSLEHLHTDYLDSFILHGPSQRSTLADQDWAAWQAMEQLLLSKKTRFLGISNVDFTQLQELYKHSQVKPSFVQNRCFADTGWDRHIRQFCKQNGIRYQGFSLLTANTHIFTRKQFTDLCTQHHCTPAQLIFSFALHRNMLVLTGTKDPSHMQEDLAAGSLTLDSSSLELLENIDLQ